MVAEIEKGSSVSVADSEILHKGQSIVSDSVQSSAPAKKGFFADFIDGFKPFEMETLDPNLTDLEKANIMSARAPLKRSLKGRHIQMIAIGGSIGTGLFVGSGSALAAGGPASLVICYALIGTMIFCMIQSLAELAVTFPVSGGFLALNSRLIAPPWGFMMAWNYSLQWLIGLPLELVAGAITINFWNDKINSAAWVTLFYLLIAFINVFGVKGYGEAEFVFSLIKVVAVVGFVILGIIITCGGGPQGGYLGGKYWHNPGSFHNGFKGFCSVFVTAAFSFAGTELVGLAAAETQSPRKTLPSATKQVFWRITLFYLVSLVIVGCLVPYNDTQLLGPSTDVSASPFVIAIRNAGINVLPSIMNVVVLVAVLSVANSSVYASSRTLATLSNQGFAPKCFGYIDRKGRPIVSVAIALAFGLLCFLAASDKQSEAFTWMMALSGLSSIFTWGSICFMHLRFRWAMKAQGKSLDELSFTALSGVYGSIWGVLLNVLILIAEFWVSLFPSDEPVSAKHFFQNYLGAVFLVFLFCVYCAVRLIKGLPLYLYLPLADIDLDTGRRVNDLDVLRAEVAENKAYIASKPWYYRVWKFWC